MIPSILLGGEEHLVIRRKIKRAVRGEFGEGIVGCVSTMPNFFSIAGRGVCNPDRPRRHADWNEWKLLLQTGKTHKGNALAIRRPPWADVPELPRIPEQSTTACAQPKPQTVRQEKARRPRNPPRHSPFRPAGAEFRLPRPRPRPAVCALKRHWSDRLRGHFH